MISTGLNPLFVNRFDSCEYKYGKIVEDFEDSKTDGKIILEVKENGGWSGMNYHIRCI